MLEIKIIWIASDYQIYYHSLVAGEQFLRGGGEGEKCRSVEVLKRRRGKAEKRTSREARSGKNRETGSKKNIPKYCSGIVTRLLI